MAISKDAWLRVVKSIEANIEQTELNLLMLNSNLKLAKKELDKLGPEEPRTAPKE